jgi:Gram-negative bacterial TonB protein C-terminal
VTPLFTILVIAGICTLLFVWLWLAGKFSDKIEAIGRVDPKRARRIPIMILLFCAGLAQLSHLLDRWVDSDEARSRKPDQRLTLIRSVQPVYPLAAKQAHIEGTVRLAAIVSSDGHVKQLTLITAIRCWFQRRWMLRSNGSSALLPRAGGR